MDGWKDLEDSDIFPGDSKDSGTRKVYYLSGKNQLVMWKGCEGVTFRTKEGEEVILKKHQGKGKVILNEGEVLYITGGIVKEFMK